MSGEGEGRNFRLGTGGAGGIGLAGEIGQLRLGGEEAGGEVAGIVGEI